MDFLGALFNAISNSSGSGGGAFKDNSKSNAKAKAKVQKAQSRQANNVSKATNASASRSAATSPSSTTSTRSTVSSSLGSSQSSKPSYTESLYAPGVNQPTENNAVGDALDRLSSLVPQPRKAYATEDETEKDKSESKADEQKANQSANTTEQQSANTDTAQSKQDQSVIDESAKKGYSTLSWEDNMTEWLNSKEGQAYQQRLSSDMRKQIEDKGAWSIAQTAQVYDSDNPDYSMNANDFYNQAHFTDSSGQNSVKDWINTYKDYDGKGTSIDADGNGDISQAEMENWYNWSRKNNSGDPTTWYNDTWGTGADETWNQAYQNGESALTANLYAQTLANKGQDDWGVQANNDGTVTFGSANSGAQLTVDQNQAEALSRLVTSDNYNDFMSDSPETIMSGKGYWTDAFRDYNNLASAENAANTLYSKDSDGKYSDASGLINSFSDEEKANMINALGGTAYGVTSSADGANLAQAGTGNVSGDFLENAASFLNDVFSQNLGTGHDVGYNPDTGTYSYTGAADTSDDRRRISGYDYDDDKYSNAIANLLASEALSNEEAYYLMGKDGPTYKDAEGVLYTR